MKLRIGMLGAGSLMLMSSLSSQAAIVSCTGIAELAGPVAPVECFQELAAPGSQDNLAWILAQSVILDAGSGLQKADKSDEGSSLAGYVLTVTNLNVSDSNGDGDISFGVEGYTHSFNVNGPDGTFLDFMVISWKQAHLLTAALFQNVLLDVEGLLFSINKNANEGVLSHGSLHVAIGDTPPPPPPPTDVPEPGSLALLGAGLLGLGLMRRRRSA